MNKKFVLTIGIILGLAITATTYASMFNAETVRIQYLFPNSGSVYNGNSVDVVVGPGFELNGYPVGDPRTNIDILHNLNQIFITFNSSARWTYTSFNGIRFEDILNSITDIAHVSINPLTNLAGLDSSRINYDNDNIFINWRGLSFNTDTLVLLDVNPIPEPASLMLMGIGLLSLGVVGRGRLKKNYK